MGFLFLFFFLFGVLSLVIKNVKHLNWDFIIGRSLQFFTLITLLCLRFILIFLLVVIFVFEVVVVVDRAVAAAVTVVEQNWRSTNVDSSRTLLKLGN